MPRSSFHVSVLLETPPAGAGPLGRSLRGVACAILGHRVDNRVFARERSARKLCSCGAPILGEDGSETRVSHTLSCFFLGHHYRKVGTRDAHCEYVCRICGHPLLFEAGRSPYAREDAFRKHVRYLCGVFGHRVHAVTERCGSTEYACHCGHSFLKEETKRATIRHPLVCVFAGHYVRLVARREGYAEHCCRNCGHTFCFVTAA